jgi:preprotein translocase subunit SecY
MLASIVEFFVKLLKSKDIRKKVLITALILIVYRLVAHIPASGIDRESLS